MSLRLLVCVCLLSSILVYAITLIPWAVDILFGTQSIVEVMYERSQHLVEHCKTLPGTQIPVNFNYFYEPRKKVLWCAIHKAASSSWMYQFNRWAGESAEKILRTDMTALARRNYPAFHNSKLEKLDPETVRFLIVRDPFDRLVSTYEHLIVQPPTLGYGNLRERIYLLNYGVRPRNGTTPSFSNFVTYVLLRPRVLDPHWNSYYNLCDPCFLQPDVVIKLETYDRDVRYLLRKANISEQDYEAQTLNVNRPKSTNGSSTTMKRIAELSAAQVEKLYRRYEQDFKLFQYDIEIYRRLVDEQEL